MNSSNTPADHPGTPGAVDDPPLGGAGAELSQELPSATRLALPELDPTALEAFFDHYFTRVYGYVRRLVREEHLAEDLTQDVFLHVQKALPSYDPARPLSPWVYTIATNKVRDLWRSRRHQEERYMQRVDDEDGGAPLAADGPTPVQEIEHGEVQDEIRDAIEELPEMLRATFVLRFYDGLSFEAIGEMVDRNEAAVRKRYSRALAELRKSLEGLNGAGGMP